MGSWTVRSLTPEQAQALLEAALWTFAKTMPKNPHYWTCRDSWNLDDYFSVLQFIRDHGTVEIWPFPRRPWSREYQYVIFGGWKYWHMELPGHPTDQVTTCINRKDVRLP